jgi:hypothetical protein
MMLLVKVGISGHGGGVGHCCGSTIIRCSTCTGSIGGGVSSKFPYNSDKGVNSIFFHYSIEKIKMVTEAAKNAIGLFIACLLLMYLWKPQPFFTESGIARPGWGTLNASLFNLGNATTVFATVSFFACVMMEN